MRFKWTEDDLQIFDCLTDHLTAIALLTYPDLSRPMVLYPDASEECMGAVLSQPCSDENGIAPGISEEISYLTVSLKPSRDER